MKRTVLSRIPIGNNDELVISIDERGNVDLRRWTLTGDLRFPSKHGLTLLRSLLPELINALKAAKSTNGT